MWKEVAAVLSASKRGVAFQRAFLRGPLTVCGGFGALRAESSYTVLGRERGPAKNQMMNPTTGRMMIRSVHRTLLPVEAGLPITLMIAQMSRPSTIRPKMNSKAASSRCATAGRRGR
jgi:hypothetical protein